MKIEDDILMLMVRHLRSETSDAADLRLREWVAASPQNREEYEKYLQVWKASEGLSKKRLNVNLEWDKFRSRHFEEKATRVIPLYFMRYAAAAVVLIGLFLSGIYFSGSNTYQTGAGERMLVQLSDGSEIILGAGSTLEVPRSFNWFSRNVELLGEANFEVAKNPEKAFQIAGPMTTTRVLGTAFKLIADKDHNHIVVAEGKVAYWSRLGRDTLILTMGETGSLKDSKLIEAAAKNQNFDSWITGAFSFENVPVLEVLKGLQDYYVFNISNPDKFEDVSCRFTGSFEGQALKDILEELSLTMGMEYSFDGNTLKIEQFYCD